MSNVEAIKKAIDFYAEYFEDEVLGDLARNAIPSLEALQRENEALRKALKPFSDHAGGLFQINFNRNDEVSAVETKDCFIFSIKAGAFFDARTALASAGEEHYDQ